MRTRSRQACVKLMTNHSDIGQFDWLPVGTIQAISNADLVGEPDI